MRFTFTQAEQESAVPDAVPVVVPVTQRPDGDFERLPHRVQRVLHHLCFVADGVSERHTQA